MLVEALLPPPSRPNLTWSTKRDNVVPRPGYVRKRHSFGCSAVQPPS